MVSTLEQMQVPNGTGLGVRRSKRPLVASRTRCNALWIPPKLGNKVKICIKVQFGNKFANWCNVWSIEGVIVYGYVPECHVKFSWRRESSRATSGSREMDSYLVLTECFSRRILRFTTSPIDLISLERVSSSTSSFLAHCLEYASHASMII